MTIITNPTTDGGSQSGGFTPVSPTTPVVGGEPIWVVFMGYYLQINCATNQVTQAVPINLVTAPNSQPQQPSVLTTPVQSPVQPTVSTSQPSSSGEEEPKCVTRQVRLSNGQCWTVNGNCQDWLDDGTCIKCYLGFNVDLLDNKKCVIT